MKKLLAAITAVLIYTACNAQTNALLGQYYNSLPAYNPALTGMYNRLDINMGIRQQWVNFDGAPRTIYLGVNGNLPFGKVAYSDSLATPGMKHGVGGYLLADKQGPYKQFEASFVYALHIPIATGTYLSMGGAPSVYNAKVDLSDVWVKDMVNDPKYQALLQNSASNTYVHLNLGLALYSSRYYVSYAMMEAINARLSGNSELNPEENTMRHHILAGYCFKLQDQFDLMPNTFVRLDKMRPAFFEVGMRARYQQNYSLGVSFRNDHTYVVMLGFAVNSKLRVGYSGEMKTKGMTQYNNKTHEINVGLRLFERSKAPTIL